MRTPSLTLLSPPHFILQVYMGGDTVESERFIDMMVILDPKMDSKLMKVSFVRISVFPFPSHRLLLV